MARRAPHRTAEASRRNLGDQAGFGIDELTEHFAKMLEQFDTANGQYRKSAAMYDFHEFAGAATR